MTKLQRMNANARKSKKTRMTKALQAYVDSVLGKGKAVGASVVKNPGGSITIKPVRKRKNVQMGFHDAHGFHPIRASNDYSQARASEGGWKRPKAKAKAKKKTAKRRAR